MSPEALLVQTIARHFPGATVRDNVVDLGFVQLGCRLGAVRPALGMHATQLLFDVAGDELRGAIELSVTGYAPTVAEAIAGAACGWACSFGPVFYAALSDDVVDSVARFDIVAGDASYRVYVDAYDYVLHFSPNGGEQPADARVRLDADPWLARRVLDRGTIALEARPQVLSIFVGELPGRRIVEMGLDGVLVQGFDDLVASAPDAKTPQMVGLRELAIIVPD
ncbi:MAG TPA: hypothetical protein VGL61_22220 [Kofleriaceae bacterium]